MRFNHYIQNFIKKTKNLFFCFIILFFQQVSHAAFSKEKLNVVATNSIISDWIKEISEYNTINLMTLVDRENDIHTFEPTPADAILLSKADIVFESGSCLEYWLNRLYNASQSKAKRINVSKDILFLNLLYENNNKINFCTENNKQIFNKKEEDINLVCEEFKNKYNHIEIDPHFWLDINQVIIAVINICKSLSHYDPLNINLYNERTLLYINKLIKLDNQIRETINLLPKEKRILITNHNNFLYFSKKYEFCYIGGILDSISTNTQDPSAQRFAKLINLIKHNQIKAIFGENTHNPSLINQLAFESGLKKPKLLYTESLGKINSPADTYINMMIYNVNTICDTLNNQ